MIARYWSVRITSQMIPVIMVAATRLAVDFTLLTIPPIRDSTNLHFSIIPPYASANMIKEIVQSMESRPPLLRRLSAYSFPVSIEKPA